MSERYAALIEFNRRFVRYALNLRELLALSLFLMAAGGVAIAKLEAISMGEGIYFAFITGLTIGYGDIVPDTTAGRMLSVAVGLIGTLFAGLVVAVATRALHDTVQQAEERDR